MVVKHLAGAAAFTALMTSTAYAGGFSEPAYQPFDWSGFYLGGNAGGAWSEVSNSLRITNGTPGYFFPPAIPGVNASGSTNYDSDGFTGGGQLGYRGRSGRIVYGVEVDFQSLDLGENRGGTFRYTTNNDPYILTSSESTDWLFTARPMIGYAMDRWLAYFTGGLAVTEVTFNQSFSEPPFTPTPARARKSDTEVGWVIGGGLEYGFAEHWSIRGEYLFTQFSPGNATGTLTNPRVATFRNSLGDLDVNIVRAGINYRF